MDGDALVLTLLNKVRVTDQSSLLVVNQVVPETDRKPYTEHGHRTMPPDGTRPSGTVHIDCPRV